MSRRLLALLFLVALALGVTWFYYEQRDAGEQPQRVFDAAPDTTQSADKGAEAEPEPAPRVRADAAIEAPVEAEASPDSSATARAESGISAAGSEVAGLESHAGQEAASTAAGQQIRVKGEAAGPAQAPAEPVAPASSAIIKGQASIPSSETAAAVVALDAEADERVQADEGTGGQSVSGRGEHVIAALPPVEGDVPDLEAGAEALSAGSPTEAGRMETRPPAAEEAVRATAPEAGEESRAWWHSLNPDGLREALAGMFRGDGEQEGPQPSSEDTAVAEALQEPESTQQEAETDEARSESLSAESIRRALAALVGGGQPVPEAGPPEPAPEPEIVEPEPIKPTFDIVRINRDRTAIIAGRAEPNAQVEVVVGERVIDRVSADRRGQWVSTPLDPLEPGDREMTVVARLEDGARIESDQVVVVAVPEPRPPQPRAVAAAEPPPPQPPPGVSSEPPPPQPAEMAASEAPPPEPPASVRAEAADRTQATRARAPEAAMAVLLPKKGAGGGRVLQTPGRISNDGKLALMVVDYDEQGKVRVSGEAPPGAPVRIYVDNRRVGDVVAAKSGEWQTVLEQELAPAVYTLRLDQLGPGGKPVARLETPFERVSQPPIEGQVEVDYVVVQPGNSLWRIARRLLGQGIKYVHIYEVNQAQIRDPDLIYPGQVFELPKDQVAG